MQYNSNKIQWSLVRRLAWKDTRRNRGRLLLFMSSIVLGIAALVAINSFNYNLQRDIDEQAASLLGADLAITGRQAMSDSLESLVTALPVERARKEEMFSMSYFPRIDHSQFVRLQALEGDFPFYGQLKTAPEDAITRLRSKGGIALVDRGLLQQHDLTVGDTIRLGQRFFPIGGALVSNFASGDIASGFAPAVYIAFQDLTSTGLVQTGSLINYSYYYRLPASYPIQTWADEQEELFREQGLNVQTVQGEKEQLSDAFSGLNTFLNLVALVSLLLGCIGVASSVLIYIKTKVPSIAVFRCLGMNGRSVFMIYLLQILGLGTLSVGLGVGLGTMVQLVLPLLFKDFLPLEVTTEIAWSAIMEGWIIGLLITFLFALVPLLPVRRISPLRILRASYEGDTGRRDYRLWGVYVAIVLTLWGFLWYLTGDIMVAVAFCVGLGLAFGLLFAVSKGIIWATQRYFPRSWNFVFRQGLSNLFRPNNQTATLLVSIGLGTAILTTLFVIQGLLLNNVAEMDAGNQPNMILYGIEKSQLADLRTLTEENYAMPIIQEVPIVTTRITAWKGKTKAEWLRDSTEQIDSWAYNREIRTTFRDTIDQFEEVLSGTFPKPRATHGDSIFISLDKRFAEAMALKLGDEVKFNVQGMPLTTYVGSIRNVDFTKMQARFFVLFPNDVLENAPQFNVLVTKSPGPDQTMAYRTEVVRNFPNISVVDLSSILSALSDILAKVSYVIQFMAVFSLLTGLIVLVSSLLLSKFQRIRESVLLRTLGASSKQLLRISLTEYFLLGSLAAATGIVIALLSSWALAVFQLELAYYVPWSAIGIVFLFVVSLVVGIGWLNNREVLQKSPLEVLRKEM